LLPFGVLAVLGLFLWGIGESEAGGVALRGAEAAAFEMLAKAACLSLLLCGLVGLFVDVLASTERLWRGGGWVAAVTGGSLGVGWTVAAYACAAHRDLDFDLLCVASIISALLLLVVGVARLRPRGGRPAGQLR